MIYIKSEFFFKHKTKLIAILSAFIVFGVLFWAYDKYTRPYAPKPQEGYKPKNVTFESRQTGIITFFHASPLIAQIKIFSDWEGRYRTKEEGNRAIFYYMNQVSNLEKELFSIEYFEEKTWDSSRVNSGAEELGRVDGTVFVLKYGSAEGLKGEDLDNFDLIIKDLDEVKKSFKIIKLR